MALNFKTGSGALLSNPLLIILIVVSLVCVGLYGAEGPEGPLHKLQSVVSGVTTPLKMVSGGVEGVENSIAQSVEDATATPETLNALREQNRELRNTVSQLEEYRQEAERLQGLLQVKDLYAAETITTRVLSRAGDPWNLVVTIDKGSQDGVRAGLPVMAPTGLIGQVESTTPLTSDVRLLADPQSGVSVLVQSSRAEGIVRGNLDGLLYLEDVDDDVEVKTGDTVITSGLGGGYFRGILLGTVAKVEGEAGTAGRKIIIEPNADATVLAEVMVVVSMSSSALDDDWKGNTANENATANGTGATADGSQDATAQQDATSQDGSGYAGTDAYGSGTADGTGYSDSATVDYSAAAGAADYSAADPYAQGGGNA